MEDNRTGSADSENGSSDSYVQVSQEDAQPPVSDPISENEPDQNREEDLDTFSEQQHEEMGIPEKPVVEEEEVVAPSSETLEDKSVESSPIEEVPIKKPQNVQQRPLAVGLLSFLNVLHPAVLYVVYWKEPKLSGVVLGGVLVTLLTLTLNTFLHTVVLFLLSFMVVSLTYIVVKIAMDSFYNRPIKNPFSDYLSKKIVLPRDKVVEWTEFIVCELDCVFNTVARLVMFDNIKNTFKFGISLWLLSFVTNCLTLLRALFIVVMLLFSVPSIYSRYREVIDRTVDKLGSSIVNNVRKVLSRVPFLKEKVQ